MVIKLFRTISLLGRVQRILSMCVRLSLQMLWKFGLKSLELISLQTQTVLEVNLREQIGVTAITFRNAVRKWPLLLWNKLKVFAFGELDTRSERGRSRLNGLTCCSRWLLETVVSLSHLSSGQFGATIAHGIQKFRLIVDASVVLGVISRGNIDIRRLLSREISILWWYFTGVDAFLELVFTDLMEHRLILLFHLGLVLLCALYDVVTDHDAFMIFSNCFAR